MPAADRRLVSTSSFLALLFLLFGRQGFYPDFADTSKKAVDFPPWSLTIIATLDGFNDMDSVEVFRWQRDGLEVYG
jgi:hypothetical protein